jgi:hypothetical protein
MRFCIIAGNLANIAGVEENALANVAQLTWAIGKQII